MYYFIYNLYIEYFVSFLYIFGTYEFSNQFDTYIIIIEFILAIIFLFEYLSRLDYAENTIAEMKSIYSIADIIAIIPAILVVFVPVFGQLFFVRSLQVLHVFRFIRIGLDNNRFFNYNLSRKNLVIAEVLTTIIIIISLHTGLILAFESGANPDITNFGSAFYYSVIALSTTDFGNVVPVTLFGKIITSVGLISAITVIPWIVVRPRNSEKVKHINCSECKKVHILTMPSSVMFVVVNCIIMKIDNFFN